MQEILALFCTIFTLGLFVCGFPSCYNIIRKKSVQGAPFEIYLLTLLTNVSSIYYGLLINDNLILRINIIGLTIQSFYILVFLYYTKAKVPCLSLLLGVIMFLLLPIYAYLNFYVMFESERIIKMGYIGTVIGICAMFGPVKGLLHCINFKTAENISLPIIYGALACGLSWTLYGLYLANIFIMLPNVLGIFINLICVYYGLKYSTGPNEKSTKKSKSN